MANISNSVPVSVPVVIDFANVRASNTTRMIKDDSDTALMRAIKMHNIDPVTVDRSNYAHGIFTIRDSSDSVFYVNTVSSVCYQIVARIAAK